jgi:4-hydroxybenzoate polyprenyltransferase
VCAAVRETSGNSRLPHSAILTDCADVSSIVSMPWLRSLGTFGSDVADLIRLRNQTGSLLLLFPTLWALVLAADGHPSLSLIAIFIAGTFIMRSAGVTINDLWDRELDRQVERTRTRPLAAGRLSQKAALAIFIGLILIAGLLLSQLNALTIALAPVALILAVCYPLAKRIIAVPQAVLGIAFGWGAIMAWAAVRSEIGWPAVGIFLATICWAVGYDTIYALQDREDDERAGVRSSALVFGSRVWLWVLVVLIAMVAILALTGIWLGLRPPFYLALLGCLGWFGYQAMRLKRHRPSRSQAFAYFKQHVWIGALILWGIWAGLPTQ